MDGEAAADVPRRRWRWVIGLLAFGVVVVALVGVGAVRTFGIGARACTMMGCVGFVAVDVTAQRDALGDGVVEVRVCRGDGSACAPPQSTLRMPAGAEPPSPTVFAVQSAFPEHPPQDLRVEVLVDGEVRLAGTVELAEDDVQLWQPNGPDCEPTCWNVDLTFVAPDEVVVA